MNELWMVTFVLMLVRTSTFMAVLPLFGRRTIPKTVLIGLTLALTVLSFSQYDVLPAKLASHPDTSISWIAIWVYSMQETMVGLFLGLAFGIFIYPLQIAGSYMAQEMGLSMATLSDPSTNNNSDVMSSMFQTLGILMFFLLDLHHFVFATLHASFSKVPLGEGIQYVSSEIMLEAFASTDEIGLSIVAPVVICLFAILVIILMLSRVAPSMNLFSVGLSVRVIAGLFFLLIFAPNIFNAVEAWFANGQNWIEGFLDAS